MRMALCLALMVAAFGATAHTAQVSSLKTQPQVQSVPAASEAPVLDFRTGQFVAAMSPVATGYYPECATMDGGYCSTVGARARCYWYNYSEPGLAICQADHTWAIY